MVDNDTAQYRIGMLRKQIENQKNNEYDIASLSGTHINTINLGVPELELLCCYYEGIVTDEQIESMKH